MKTQSNNNQRVKQFYVYGHYTNDDKIFYIGVGTILNFKSKKHSQIYSRAYHFSNRTNYWNNISNKCGVNVKILSEFYTKEESLQEEKRLIEKFGRKCMNNGILCNLSSGGEIGPIGRIFKMSEEQKRKISEIRRMAQQSVEFNAKQAIDFGLIDGILNRDEMAALFNPLDLINTIKSPR